MSILETLALKGSQPDAATTRRRDISVSAGAGSGKTKTLVARYLSLLDERHPPRTVIAITFTKKAAREMRNRVRQEIHDWINGKCPETEKPYWREIAADIDTARIGTIHSLCEAVLRAHPAEAQIDPGFNVLDEGLGAALLAQVVEETLNWAAEQPRLAPLFDAFSTRVLQTVLAALVSKRLDASPAFARRDLAATWDKALQEKLDAFAIQVSDATNVLAGMSAADLAQDAGDKLAAQVNGFMREWNLFQKNLAGGDALPAIQHLFLARRDYCNGTIGKRDSHAKQATKFFRETYDETMEWLGGKNKDDAPPDPARQSQLLELIPLLESLYGHALASYKSYKDIRHELDFDDLEEQALVLLQQPAIRAPWQTQTNALLVDEFQDTNERQREIIEALAGTADGITGRLFVVGDAKQSIYRFRGADVGVFRALDATIRARGGLPLTLGLTFRAHPALIQALNEILQAIMSSESPYAVPFEPLESQRSQPPIVAAPFIEFLWGKGENAKEARDSAAALLAERLLQLHENEKVKWQDIALLFRASAGFPAYEQALQAAGIPFVTVAGRGFYDRPEIRDLLNILRALANPWDDLAMAGLLRSPAFGITDAALYLLRWSNGEPTPANYWTALAGEMTPLQEIDRVRARRAHAVVTHLTGMIDRVTVAELLKHVLDSTLYPAILSAHTGGSRLVRNVEKLLADAQASQIVRVQEFLEYIESLHEAGAREGEAPSEAGQAIRLMTIHKAKGLEFPVVVLADASRGRPGIRDAALVSPELGLVPAPDRWDEKPLIFALAKILEQAQADAEDLRLLYVAATRASDKVIFCGHPARTDQTWLDKLANAAGLARAAVIDKAGAWVDAKLPQSGQPVHALAKQIEPRQIEDASEPELTASASDKIALYPPLVTQTVVQVDPKETDSENPERRLRRVVGKHRRPDGTILGTLVHAALRRWKFPGDAGIDDLLRAEALTEGVVEVEDYQRTIAQAKELLARLSADPRFAEINSTERWHEVPYALPAPNGDPAQGMIDLLYRPKAGAWAIVDFKTDDLRDESELLTLKSKYTPQVVRYREAFHRLLSQPAVSWLCFLNYGGRVRWEEINAEV